MPDRPPPLDPSQVERFVAASHGELEIVQAMLAAYPAIRHAAGPHGIPLIAHAQAGGEDARAVVEFLESVPATT